MKILKKSEVKDRKLYSEEYQVSYWFQKFDGSWVEKSDTYFSASENNFANVELRWKKDHKKDNVRLIEII